MPFSGTKQKLKVDTIVDGILILQDTYVLLNKQFWALKEGNTRTLLILLSNIQLSVTGICTVETTLDDVLRHDSSYDVSKTLTSVMIAQENVEKKINDRYQQTTHSNSRKPNRQIRLENMAFPSNK